MIDFQFSRKVRIYYSAEFDTIVLAKKDKSGWWKYFSVFDDFIHMDHSPFNEKGDFKLIGTFEVPEGETLMGARL